MSNEVAKVFGGGVKVADMQALAEKAQAAADNSPRGGAPNGSEYLNFSGKRGVYTVRDNGTDRPISPDELWLVDVTSVEEGWVCWKGGQPAASRMANIYTAPPVSEPDPQELGPFDTAKGDGWFSAKALVMRSFDENNVQGYFKINSVSGVAAMADLIGQFAQRARAGTGAWPVVSLDVEQFESKGYKNYKPVFDVVGWLTDEQVAGVTPDTDIAELLGLEEEQEVVPVPKPKAKPGRSRLGRG